MTFTKEQLQQIIETDHVQCGEASSLARIALASLEAEPVAWLLSGGGAKNNVSFDSGNAYADPLREVTPLYTAHPAPVSVPAAMEMDDDFDSAFEHGKAVGWNAYRAAMLKHSEPFIVTSDHRMMEMPQVEDINAVAAMLQGKAEPVSQPDELPDGWVAVPVDMTPEMMRAVQINSELGAYAAANLTGAYSLFREFWGVAVTAAPQQEMK